jgi:eukaryotic translation initiation factor 2C
VHPAPGADGKPSFTSVVGNVDSATSKYIATTRVQTSRQEMIDDLQEMCQVRFAFIFSNPLILAQHIVTMYSKYRVNVEKKAPWPKRIIFYRGPLVNNL